MSDLTSNLSAELRNPAYNDESDGHVRLRAADEIDRLTERLAGAYASVNLLTEMLEAKAPQEARETPVDWSFIRRVLEQGAAIQQDYAAGKYPTYEHYSARIDEAARERLATISAPVEPLPAPCSECERLRAGLSLIATDEHRLMNITARMTAESILSGKPIGAPVTKEIGHEFAGDANND